MRLPLTAIAVALALPATTVVGPGRTPKATASVERIERVSGTAPVRYRLCQDPAKHYLVVAVHKAGCVRAHRVAVEYFRRLYGQSDGNWRHVFGYSCGRAQSGTFYGLFGSRAYCRNGEARIRFEYRGE